MNLIEVCYHVNNIPTIQKYSSKSYNMLSLTECVWDFQDNALRRPINMPYCYLPMVVPHVCHTRIIDNKPAFAQA